MSATNRYKINPAALASWTDESGKPITPPKTKTVRAEADNYATPLESFRPLLPWLKFLPTPFWEPAAGDWRLVDELNREGLKAFGSDLRGYPGDIESEWRRDFLTEPITCPGTILTNPPFSRAFEFCQQAVKLCPNVVLLLRLNFLASQKRAPWFREHKPTALFILSKRPSFTGRGTDACDYAWVVWSPCVQGIYWI